MNTTKILISTLIGGITLFFMGFIFYALLLAEYFKANMGTASGVFKEDDMVWWALILGNFVTAGLFTLAIGKWAGKKTFMGGANAGAIFGLLFALGSNLANYATSNVINLPHGLVDAALWVIIGSVLGGIVGLINGKGSQA